MTELPLLPITMLVLLVAAFGFLTRGGPLGRILGFVTLAVFALLPALTVPMIAGTGRAMPLDYVLLGIGALTIILLAWRVIPTLMQASRDTNKDMTRIVGSSHN